MSKIDKNEYLYDSENDNYDSNYADKYSEDGYDYTDKSDYEDESDKYEDSEDYENPYDEEENEFEKEDYDDSEDYNKKTDKDFEEEKIKIVKKRRKTKATENGKDVRERFYDIMNDYHSGNEAKRTQAIEDAIAELEGFIHSIIKRSYSTYTKNYFYDLLQEGRLGVVIGLEKYDPSISMPTTFFFPYIKHEMQGFITKQVDKTTSHYSSNIKKINKVIEEFDEKGVNYTNVDISIQTGMTLETVNQSMAIRNYRDEIHIDGCQPGAIDEKQSKDKYVTPEEAYIEKEENEIIYDAINKNLTEQEIQVLELHFGINNTTTISEGEISKKLGIPKDKVKKTLNTAIRKLKESDLKNMFRDHLAEDTELIEEAEFSFVPSEMAENIMDSLEDIDIDI